MDGWTDGRIDGWMDTWLPGRTDIQRLQRDPEREGEEKKRKEENRKSEGHGYCFVQTS